MELFLGRGSVSTEMYAGWRDLWDPLRPDLLPRAIELVVRPVRGPDMRYVFLVGAGA